MSSQSTIPNKIFRHHRWWKQDIPWQIQIWTVFVNRSSPKVLEGKLHPTVVNYIHENTGNKKQLSHNKNQRFGNTHTRTHTNYMPLNLSGRFLQVYHSLENWVTSCYPSSKGKKNVPLGSLYYSLFWRAMLQWSPNDDRCLQWVQPLLLACIRKLYSQAQTGLWPSFIWPVGLGMVFLVKGL